MCRRRIIKIRCGHDWSAKIQRRILGEEISSNYASKICIIKPQLEEDIQRAFSQIPKLLSGEDVGKQADKDYCFIETEEQFSKYKQELEDAPTLVVDIETTSVSPHTGVILGIAISTRPHQGLYVSIDVVNAHKQWFHMLFVNRKCIFHNSKFDTNYMETELGFEFPDYEDTMLLLTTI